MRKKTTLQACACLVTLLLLLLPPQAARNKAITPVLGLLLAGNKTCVSTDPINILSIQADRFSPFNLITLTVDNISSIVPGTSSITYGDLEVPIASLDYGNNTITSLLPNTPGTF